MSLQVNVNTGTRPSPQIVADGIVVQHARAVGSPNAAQALAVTVPVCNVNQTQLQYEQRNNSGQIEFRFQTGILQLSLRQSIYIANTLSDCAQNIWAEHEQDHVSDNQQVMGRMDQAIRAHRTLQSIFITPKWRPRSAFNALQATIQSTVGEIFRDLTTAAVQNRDTSSIYDAIRERIRRQCGP